MLFWILLLVKDFVSAEEVLTHEHSEGLGAVCESSECVWRSEADTEIIAINLPSFVN